MKKQFARYASTNFDIAVFNIAKDISLYNIGISHSCHSKIISHCDLWQSYTELHLQRFHLSIFGNVDLNTAGQLESRLLTCKVGMECSNLGHTVTVVGYSHGPMFKIITGNSRYPVGNRCRQKNTSLGSASRQLMTSCMV